LNNKKYRKKTSIVCIAKTEVKKPHTARCQWLTPIVLAIQEAEIRKITVRSQPGQTVRETLSQKTSSQQKRAGEVA
jgi:hypothetical protein